MDVLEIKVEISEGIPFMDELKTLEALRMQLARKIKAALDVEATVIFVEPRSLRKAPVTARVVDNRPG